VLLVFNVFLFFVFLLVQCTLCTIFMLKNKQTNSFHVLTILLQPINDISGIYAL